MDDDSKWTRASLRLFSTVLAPEELGDILGIQPDSFYRIGDPVGSRSPSARSVQAQHAFFVESGVSEDQQLEIHLEALLSRIEPVADRLRSLRDRADADVFCGFSSANGQGGFTLTPQMLRRLANLELALGLDLYPPPPQDT